MSAFNQVILTWYRSKSKGTEEISSREVSATKCRFQVP